MYDMLWILNVQERGTIKHFKLEISACMNAVCLCVQNEILKFYGLKRKPQNENKLKTNSFDVISYRML